ncbi:MAG: hypothetical protein L0H53_08120 [Candidatus Nitrosocosmicus sp.]|nr:hypothetical protein [Candidatus Nitrosocosmicus sp.]MDN5868144.1 hypothetical protein [Candidatus Nitrosocosmicus sp.]
MNYRLQITIVALVVTTMALAPSLVMNQSAEAASHIKCEDEKGKSHTWISGCKDGWYNWDVCGLGPTEGDKGQYAEGYIAGWKKGKQHDPSRTGC